MKEFREAAMTAMLCLAMAAGTGVAAQAEGTGNTVGGCTAKWWNTSFSSSCLPATMSASFRTKGWCDYQPTVSGNWQWVGKGSRVTGVSPAACTFGVYDAATYAS